LGIPDVTIILPVRNGARYLNEAIRSALATQQPDRELIIIDDGSTDRTPALIEAAARADPRVVALGQPAQGLVAALERGRRHARAPLIARLDADDLAYPQRFERQVAAFAASRELVLLGAAADRIDEAGRIVGRIAYPSGSAELRRALGVRNPFVHSMVMFRADCAHAVGGYRAFFLAAEDYDLWLRLAEHGEVANMEDCLGAVRTHAESVSRRFNDRQIYSAAMARRCAEARRRWKAGAMSSVVRADQTDARFPDELDQNDIRLFEALEFALPQTFAVRQPTHQNVTDLMTAAGFDREEKKLAQRALVNILARRKLPNRLSWARVAAAFVRINPPRAVRLAPRIFRSLST
jgi:glycosyltransferase involved in cell wall biosynthesis